MESTRANLVCTVPKTLQLVDSPLCLDIGIISCTNSTHAGWLVASVGLRRVLEIRIGPTGTVTEKKIKIENPYRHPYTQTPPVIAMWGHRWGLLITATTAICKRVKEKQLIDTHPRRCSDRLHFEKRKQGLLVLFWNRSNKVSLLESPSKSVLSRDESPHRVKIHSSQSSSILRFNKDPDDLRQR